MNSQGNDFILVDSSISEVKLLPDLAKSFLIQNINYDQLLYVELSKSDELVTCSILNRDGSVAKQCGNGLRAIMLYFNNRYGYKAINIEVCGTKYKVKFKDTENITVQMGKTQPLAISERECGVVIPTEQFHKQSECIDNITEDIVFYLVDIGNQHCVIIDKHIPDDKHKIIQHLNKNYNNQFNIEFLENLTEYINGNSQTLILSVYERGAGWTDSCGSGATAAASVIFYSYPEVSSTGSVSVQQKGGLLSVFKEPNGLLYLSGPSTLEYEASIYV
tara:strand:- start:34393 stop:35220 length:828 start_codon:yes stop_codon:yes gene_type:complete